MDSIIAALVAVVGVVVGAVLQSILFRATEFKKSLEELRTHAYLDRLPPSSFRFSFRQNW
jgi:hypothetical protein